MQKLPFLVSYASRMALFAMLTRVRCIEFQYVLGASAPVICIWSLGILAVLLSHFLGSGDLYENLSFRWIKITKKPKSGICTVGETGLKMYEPQGEKTRSPTKGSKMFGFFILRSRDFFECFSLALPHPPVSLVNELLMFPAQLRVCSIPWIGEWSSWFAWYYSCEKCFTRLGPLLLERGPGPGLCPKSTQHNWDKG